MPEKTVKVDEAVHERLEELKIKYGVETFNQVLRHELGIISGPNVSVLSAFLHEDLKNTVERAVDTIRQIDEFEERVTEDMNREVLEFVNPDSNRLIASVRFDEHSFQIQYRAQNGEMKNCGRGWYTSTSEEPQYGRTDNISTNTDPQEVIEQTETKVTGAHRRWSSNP